MRDYKKELENRIEFIRSQLRESGAKGIIFGNSGGKDCALVGILCKMACEDTVCIQLPCHSKQNFGSDMDDALAVAKKFNIAHRTFDLTPVREAIIQMMGDEVSLNNNALVNLPPRLRMTTLYTVAAAEGRLVAGTGNRSERYMGYFTKHGDGGCDFNPISDLTVGEVYEFLRFLDAPASVIEKAPSAGLYEGQTDEKDMGVTYAEIDEYILNGTGKPESVEIIKRYHRVSEHKRRMPATFAEVND
ncbi:MAG: NAD(+) synthase [Oscillospiraceae bacterium]|nr:NAD(+) synthase [Oscillospiraceae bacterium]